VKGEKRVKESMGHRINLSFFNLSIPQFFNFNLPFFNLSILQFFNFQHVVIKEYLIMAQVLI